jgi:hypothetical protein
MGIIAKNNAGGERILAPAGTHLARCYKMIHFGTIEDSYNGESRWVNKVLIEWELPNELRVFDQSKGPQPISISKEFALSMHPKSTLRAFLTSWRGKGFTEEEAVSFDVTKLVGAACQLSIVHEPKQKFPGEFYAKISSVSSLMKGVKAPEQINPSFIFELDPFKVDVFNQLPDYFKNKVMGSKEYQQLMNPEVAHREELAAKVESWKAEEEEEDVMPF